MRGGREIWGLPKELATFAYGPTRFEAAQDAHPAQRPHPAPPGRLPLVVPAPIVSEAGATLGHRPREGRAGARDARRPAATARSPTSAWAAPIWGSRATTSG